ncbi:hypothetical protein TSUD_163600 [Trifolium subterraneum]|uniref:non-specific serine/threonine protein kinase n=1 Tax=Trifolium subterraneum TaxID=3900 RepID=A0A2Z6NSE0_TRISU|nr:hypothetical protein TSUD_163600 [Trifolium subterraneum]
MFLNLVLVFFLVTLVASKDNSFIYNNGFQSSHLYLDGIANLTSNGIIRLTNDTKQEKAHAFYPNPIVFKNTSNGSVSSFSTSFVFAIRPQYATLSGHGIVFVVSPTKGLPYSIPSQYLGLFNKSNNGNTSNHVFGVELDTIVNNEFSDINDNHVGIDINDLNSTISTPAGYYDDNNGQLKNLTLFSGYPMQVWIEYDSEKTKIDVTLAPINVVKPKKSLLSLTKDLSPILNNSMYVGFSSATGSVFTSHYILGWSFKVNGKAQDLIISQLPKLPRFGVIYFIKRKNKFAEILEDWEHEYGYLAPEHTRTGKATKFSDVFAFGAFLLEVVCGKRPIDHVSENETVILVDYVFERWKNGEILEAMDQNLGSDYVSEEVELVLKLGLLCSHSEPMARPSMRQVVQFLERDIPLPDLSLLSLSSSGLTFGYQQEYFEDFPMSYPSSSMDKTMSHTSVSIADSLLSGGR